MILVAVNAAVKVRFRSTIRQPLRCLLSGRLTHPPVAQRIEQWFPKPCAQVQLLPGGPATTREESAAVPPLAAVRIAA